MGGKKQEISVPFCWEEVPGTPKRNWNKTSINASPIMLPLPPPPAVAKPAVSIPFKWEEKPGTPLPFFLSQQHHQSSSCSSSSYDQDETISPVSQYSDGEEEEDGLIEWMFPLLSSTRSSHLEKVGYRLGNGVRKVGGMNEDESKVFNEMKRPLVTLGEMLMMSKRRSSQNKTKCFFTKDSKRRKAFLSSIKRLMDNILSKRPHMNWPKQQLHFK